MPIFFCCIFIYPVKSIDFWSRKYDSGDGGNSAIYTENGKANKKGSVLDWTIETLHCMQQATDFVQHYSNRFSTVCI